MKTIIYFISNDIDDGDRCVLEYLHINAGVNVLFVCQNRISSNTRKYLEHISNEIIANKYISVCSAWKEAMRYWKESIVKADMLVLLSSTNSYIKFSFTNLEMKEKDIMVCENILNPEYKIRDYSMLVISKNILKSNCFDLYLCNDYEGRAYQIVDYFAGAGYDFSHIDDNNFCSLSKSIIKKETEFHVETQNNNISDVLSPSFGSNSQYIAQRLIKEIPSKELKNIFNLLLSTKKDISSDIIRNVDVYYLVQGGIDNNDKLKVMFSIDELVESNNFHIIKIGNDYSENCFIQCFPILIECLFKCQNDSCCFVLADNLESKCKDSFKTKLNEIKYVIETFKRETNIGIGLFCESDVNCDDIYSFRNHDKFECCFRKANLLWTSNTFILNDEVNIDSFGALVAKYKENGLNTSIQVPQYVFDRYMIYLEQKLRDNDGMFNSNESKISSEPEYIPVVVDIGVKGAIRNWAKKVIFKRS